MRSSVSGVVSNVFPKLQSLISASSMWPLCPILEAQHGPFLLPVMIYAIALAQLKLSACNWRACFICHNVEDRIEPPSGGVFCRTLPVGVHLIVPNFSTIRRLWPPLLLQLLGQSSG